MQCGLTSSNTLVDSSGLKYFLHVTTVNCECRQQLDGFPLGIDDSERDRLDSNLDR